MKRFFLWFLVVGLLVLGGGSLFNEVETSKSDWIAADWNAIENAAKGSTVRWYMWAGTTRSTIGWIPMCRTAQGKVWHHPWCVSPWTPNVFVNKLLTEKKCG